MVVGAGAALFSWLFLVVFGRPFMHEKEALETLRVMSPIDSMTVWYAALTGVVLWLASMAGGWFDNWCVYHRLPDGIAQRPARTEWGRTMFARRGSAFQAASGWGTNVSLGFMLGMMPEIGRFTGLPADVRHVTLNTGIVSLAASAGAETGANQLAWLIRAMAGIGVMFVLNLSVSFACSLFSAARAYELPAGDVRGILTGIGKRLVRTPWSSCARRAPGPPPTRRRQNPGRAAAGNGPVARGWAVAYYGRASRSTKGPETVTQDLSSQLSALVSTYLVPFGWKLLGALAVWIIGGWVVRLVRAALGRFLVARHVDATLIRYLDASANVLMKILVLIGVLGVLGIETTSFAALIAAVGVAIGAAWAGLLSNFAAGIFLMVLRPFKVGDFIQGGGMLGTVREIGLFVTAIDTPDNVRTFVGNAKLFSDTIQNFRPTRSAASS